MHRFSRPLAAAAALTLGVATAAAAVTVGSAHSARAATAWPAHVFAPYVDTGLSNTTLTTVAADYGTQFFMLAFVDGGGCQWSLPNESSWQSQITALRAEGGDVAISFGGYTVDTDGDDLGAQCSSASAMATQVESVVTTLNVTHLDFDIESSEETNTADVALTAQALTEVRQWASGNGEQLTISYTIPVLPTRADEQRRRRSYDVARQRLHPEHRQHHDDGLRHIGHGDGHRGEPGARRHRRPAREHLRHFLERGLCDARQYPNDRAERYVR
jgi:hypothetical protein